MLASLVKLFKLNTAQKNNFPLRISSDLVTFTEEILDGILYSCAVEGTTKVVARISRKI